MKFETDFEIIVFLRLVYDSCISAETLQKLIAQRCSIIKVLLKISKNYEKKASLFINLSISLINPRNIHWKNTSVKYFFNWSFKHPSKEHMCKFKIGKNSSTSLQHNLKWGPETQDSGPRTLDSRPQNLGPQDFELFIELQNKTLMKSNKSLTSKREKANYSFTYFSLIRIMRFFFLELRSVSEIFRKILGTFDYCLSDLSRWSLFWFTSYILFLFLFWIQ